MAATDPTRRTFLIGALGAVILPATHKPGHGGKPSPTPTPTPGVGFYSATYSDLY